MTFKEQCISLRERDYTLTEIAKITGRPKTSVYAHIQYIPLSEKKREECIKAQGARIRKYALMRKGKSVRKFSKFSEWNDNTVSAVSHFLFDGEIKHGHCTYHNRNDALLSLVERRMKDIYEYEPRRYFNKFTGVARISYFNVALSNYLKEKSRELLQGIFDFPPKLKREFLRSFFDDEGCIDFRPVRNTRRVRGYQKNVNILNIIRKLLADFKIHSFVQLPNEVVIVYKENLEKFQKEIGFSPGVRINGKRSNSIWKQSLEKREILRRAIASYKPIGSNGVHRNPRALTGDVE